MSANGIWKSRFEKEPGYGDTLWTAGQVNIVDGKVYMEGIALDQYFKDLDGKIIGFEVVLGLPHFETYPAIDEKIAPLVNALRARGVRTLHSCEGHMTPRDKYSFLCPQVDFPVKDAKKLPAIPKGWTLEPGPWGDPQVVRLRPMKDAKTEAELLKMQGEAKKFAATLA
jgi:hypothetical protein